MLVLQAAFFWAMAVYFFNAWRDDGMAFALAAAVGVAALASLWTAWAIQWSIYQWRK